MFLKSSGFGCGGGFFGTGTFASSFLASCFLPSSFFSASVAGSGLASAFFSACCGFASGLASALGSGGLGSGGLGSGGLGSGGLGAGSDICAEAVMISGFSATLVAALSTGLASATFSTSGLAAWTLGAVLIPAVIWENSVTEMMSIGRASVGGTSCGFTPKDTAAHSSAAACPTSDMVSPILIRPSGALLDLGDQRHAAEARLRQAAHDPHHRTVIDFLVAANVNSLVHAPAGLGNGLQLGNQFLDLDLGFLQVHLALGGDRHRQGLLDLVEALGLGLRQVDGHPDREQGGRDHDDDQQYEHHVDHRRDVDLGHDGLAPVASPADRPRCGCAVCSHGGSPQPRSSICRDRMAANSSAKPSSRCACLFTSETNLL